MDVRQLHEYRLAAVAVVAAGFFSSLYLPGWRAWAAIAGLVVAAVFVVIYSVLIHKRNGQYRDARRFSRAYLEEANTLARRARELNVDHRAAENAWCDSVRDFVCAIWGEHWYLTFQTDARSADRLARTITGLVNSLAIVHELPVETDFEWKSRPDWWQYLAARPHLTRKWTARQRLETRSPSPVDSKES